MTAKINLAMLCELLCRNSISLAEVLKQAGHSGSMGTRITKGQPLRTKTIGNIAKVLNADVADLIVKG